MSFHEAEASDATLNGIAAVLRTALEHPNYRRNPHQVYDNMDSDALIGSFPEPNRPKSRIELLREVDPLRSQPSAISEKVVHFCRSNLQQGPVYPTASVSTLGRVQRLRSLIDNIADSSFGLSLRNADALVRDVIFNGANATEKLVRQKAELAGKRLSKYQMWSYLPPDTREPFREIGDRADAVNVLGLGFYAYDEPTADLVRWAHSPPASIQTHSPTAWDAGSDKGNVHWRPGGRTYQLESDEYGLTEIVHNPISGEHLTFPIEPLV